MEISAIAVEKKVISGRTSEQAIISLVVPVYNQDSIIKKNLISAFLATKSYFDVAIVDDASTDSSFQQIREALEWASVNCANFVQGTILRLPKAVYETRSDVLGIANTAAPYIVEIQADINITEHAYDVKILKAYRANRDVILISGRGTEPLNQVISDFHSHGGVSISNGRSAFSHLFFSFRGPSLLRSIMRKLKSFLVVNSANSIEKDDRSRQAKICPDPLSFSSNQGRAGRLGDEIDENYLPNPQDNDKLWLGQTVMRGPLAIRRDLYNDVGGFDDNSFFLGFDDHDLSLRAWAQKKYRVAYLPMGFESPLQQGTTRKKRTLRNNFEIFQNMLRVARHRNKSILNRRNAYKVELPSPEIRSF